MLVSLVIKLEQHPTRHQGSGQVCCPPFVSTFPVTNKPLSISAFETPFLTCEPAAGERACAPKTSGEQPAKLSSLARKNGVERLAKSAFLTETDPHSEIAVTHSKQTTAKFLTETRIAHLAFRMVSREPRNSAFLTGSGSQTEIDVTHRKQTTARTHISDSAAQRSNNAPQEDKCPSRR